jgi:hypothetical protein
MPICSECIAARRLIFRITAKFRELRFIIILCIVSIGTVILMVCVALSKAAAKTRRA